MIPKPSKAPVTPSNLRPLVLQDPIGKAVIGLLIQIAMHQAKDFMVLFPLWAYVEHRSTLDAIPRVSLHCALVRQFLLTQRSTPHSRAVDTMRYGFYGGFQLCLDLKHAFDNVDRCKLFQQLPNLNISEDVAVLLSTWHEHTTYVVQHDDGDSPIPTGRGVRQGCKAAPGLWNCFVMLFCQQLLEFIPLTWIQQNITVYADDFHIGAAFTTYDEFRTLQKYLGIIFLLSKTWTCRSIPKNLSFFLNSEAPRADDSDVALCGRTMLASVSKLMFRVTLDCISLSRNPPSILE